MATVAKKNPSQTDTGHTSGPPNLAISQDQNSFCFVCDRRKRGGFAAALYPSHWPKPLAIKHDNIFPPLNLYTTFIFLWTRTNTASFVLKLSKPRISAIMNELLMINRTTTSQASNTWFRHPTPEAELTLILRQSFVVRIFSESNQKSN